MGRILELREPTRLLWQRFVAWHLTVTTSYAKFENVQLLITDHADFNAAASPGHALGTKSLQASLRRKQMNRLSKIVAALGVAAVATTVVAAPTPASAYPYRYGYGHYGYGYGGFGYGFGTGALLGFGLGALAARPYYAPPVVVAPPVVYAAPPAYYPAPGYYYSAPVVR